MNIRNKLSIITILSVVCVGMVSTILITSIFKMEQLTLLEQQSAHIAKATAELVTITEQYVIHANDRTLQQWTSRYQSLLKILNSIQVNIQQEKILLRSLKQRVPAIKELFLKLVLLEDNKQTQNPDRQHNAARELLVGRLMEEAQALIHDSFELQLTISNKLLNSNRKTSLIVISIIASLFSIVLVVAWLIKNSVITPLAQLQRGIERVSKGDLLYKLYPGNEDEIGKLALSFDVMTHNLHKRTQELESTKEAALQASNAKSDFLSRMSHELRTPMNAILGFGQILELDHENNLSPQQKDNIREIMQAGNHLLELINEVLDLSHVESGKMKMDLSDVDIYDSIYECRSNLLPLAKSRNISITLQNPQTDKYSVVADKFRLKQAILNLLSNAIKYNRDNGEIFINWVQTQNKTVCIKIRDTGLGISESNLDRLFTAFDRLDNSYSAIEGTGIGLVLAKRFVELMHGSIGVESKVGIGSSFWIELPIYEQNIQQQVYI